MTLNYISLNAMSNLISCIYLFESSGLELKKVRSEIKKGTGNRYISFVTNTVVTPVVTHYYTV